jgi:hypothetical protein
VATVAYYDITGVDGIDDRRQGALQSVSFDARFRLFEREHAPFGLTLSVEPLGVSRTRLAGRLATSTVPMFACLPIAN